MCSFICVSDIATRADREARSIEGIGGGRLLADDRVSERLKKKKLNEIVECWKSGVAAQFYSFFFFLLDAPCDPLVCVFVCIPPSFFAYNFCVDTRTHR